MNDVVGANDCRPMSNPIPVKQLLLRRSTELSTLAVLVAVSGTSGCHREVPKAPFNFRVSLETEGCSEDLQSVVVQLDQHAPASGPAYRFEIDSAQQVVDGTIQDLPEGTYHATVTGRTSGGRNTCSQGATVLVSSRGTGRAALKLTCENACTGSEPEINAIACPSLDPVLPSTLQFTDVPFVVDAHAKRAASQPVWSSSDLSFVSQGEKVRAECKQAKRKASATVSASNASCVVREAVNVKCVDAKVTPLGASNLVASNWREAVPGRTMPVTRAVYRASCDRVVQQQLGSVQTCTNVGSFCSCEWTGKPSDNAALPTSFDGPVLGGAADEAVSEEHLEELRNQLADIGRKYLGVPPASGEAATAQAKQQATGLVRVAVIDTTAVPPYDLQSGQPTPPADNNLHGRAVSLVIADTACGAFGNMSECPVKVHNYLALNVLGSHNGETQTIGVDDVHGGHAGTLTDLGLAIRRAVDDWKPNAANERLIVNISAGWDPVWGGAADAVKGATGLANAGVTGTPELVLESLAYASCSGALVFAAAGNRTAPYRSSVPETAIYPAAWATLPAPTIQECEALGVSGAKPEAGAPLLHAVGGLDFWGGRLMTSRPGASPMLATLGLNVVRQDPYGAPHHAPTLTGTSMSTAAVSGVAAYLWMQNPNLQSAQLAAQLYRSGQPTAHAANVCFGPTPCSEVRNVVLCGAQGDAAPIGCNPTPPAIEVPASAALELEEPIALELEAAEELLPGTGEQPWVYPQPPDDPSCGVCQFQTQNNKLDIHWIDSFQPSHILQMRIYLNDNSGYWTIPISIAQSKQDFRVTLSGASGETSAGTVRYKYDLGTSVITIEESLVVP